MSENRRNNPDGAVTEADIKSFLAEQRRLRRKHVALFERACCEGDVDAFHQAAAAFGELVSGGWPPAFARVGKLDRVHPDIQQEFVSVWVESKMLGLEADNRAALVRALRLLFPRSEVPKRPIDVYRGAAAMERTRGRYGLCWTTDLNIARRFAVDYRQPNGSVVLKATVIPDAVLFVREDIEGYYAESEVVVDPFRIGRVQVIERLPASASSAPGLG
jgi:hypothetical protein